MHFRDHWQLNPDIDFLNHGSFGACPSIVLQNQRELIDQLERDPIRFLAPERDLEPKLDEVRQLIGQLVNAPTSDVAFVRNATDGVNAVLSSFPFNPLDEILITNHGYNACNNAAHHAAKLTGAKVAVAEVPFPLHSNAEVLDAIERQLNSRTRVLLIDHVTSPTGLIFPIEDIIALAHDRGVQVLVDGAHAAGMLPLDLSTMAADYYTANHHKWLCAPKSSGFLYVQPDLQHQVRPSVISHGANQTRPRRSRFITEFDWAGTFDPTPILALKTAIEFLESLYPGGLTELYRCNHEKTISARNLLCDALQIAPPCADNMIGSLASIPLTLSQLDRHSTANLSANLSATEQLQHTLVNEHRFELPVYQLASPDQCCLRISMQAYNDLSQVDRLAKVMARFLN